MTIGEVKKILKAISEAWHSMADRHNDENLNDMAIVRRRCANTIDALVEDIEELEADDEG